MLDQKQIEFYAENGYLHLPGVLSAAEVAQLQAATDRLIEFASSLQVPQPDYSYIRNPESGQEVLRRINFPGKRSIECQALYGQPGMLAITEGLLGRDFIVADDALVIKMPEYGAPVPWHRDLATGVMHRASDSLAVIGVDLDASTVENGAVHVVPGSHKWDMVDMQDMMDEHGFNIPGAVAVETQAGDVLVHAANLLHASRVGRGGRLRRTIYFGTFGIGPYMSEYEASASLVKLQMQYMFRGIQLRQKLAYLQGEQPFAWKGSAAWQIDLDETDHVEWGVPSARPG